MASGNTHGAFSHENEAIDQPQLKRGKRKYLMHILKGSAKIFDESSHFIVNEVEGGVILSSTTPI